MVLATALREIRFYQKQSGIIFSRATFSRCVQSAIFGQCQKNLRISVEAMAALHHAAEAALLTWFELLYVPFRLLLLI